MSELAKKFNISQSAMERMFRNSLTMLPREYIIRRRMDAAREFLRQGQSVTDACNNAGFGDYSHFIADFRRFYNTTPAEYAKQHELLEAGSTVVAGVSGGADSVALLHILKALEERLSITVAAAHFNHRIRGESADADEAFVKALCERLSVPLLCGGADVLKAAKEEGKTLEQAARDLRYAFLEEARQHFGAAYIAVAHHMDDQAETVLMHLVRGAGAAGLRGMQPKRGRIIRPLLFLRRQEIEAYLAENSIPYRTDETNLLREGTRNRIRLDVMPYLSEHLNEHAAENIAAAAALLGEDERAKNVFSEVLDRNPKNADAMLLQSQLYLQNADIGKAKELLSAFLQIREGDANQLAVMAQLCYGTGDHEGTLSYGRRSLEKAPSEDGQLYRAMAYAAMLQNGFAEARDYLTHALELLGEDAEMLYYRGVCSLSFEEYESALSDFTAAIDGGMEEGLVYYNRAVCYLAFEDWEPFRADLERVVELDDDAELKAIAQSLLKELEDTGQQEQ